MGHGKGVPSMVQEPAAEGLVYSGESQKFTEATPLGGSRERPWVAQGAGCQALPSASRGIL